VSAAADCVDGALLPPTEQVVSDAVATVDDPEYPDISIRDLGLVETIRVDGDTATIGLIPTFSGCPALSMIAADVHSAVMDLQGIEHCTVEWLTSPVWNTDRVSMAARSALGSDYTVTLRRKDGTLRCPSCGADDVSDQSAAGPTRCRSIAWCNSCRNVVEVMR
jgi:ring-1,2-phenylacetyl-CoA epoxidase subunit PaaD